MCHRSQKVIQIFICCNFEIAPSTFIVCNIFLVKLIVILAFYFARYHGTFTHLIFFIYIKMVKMNPSKHNLKLKNCMRMTKLHFGPFKFGVVFILSLYVSKFLFGHSCLRAFSY